MRSHQRLQERTCLGQASNLFKSIDPRYIVGLVLALVTLGGIGQTSLTHFISAMGTVTLVSVMAGERLSYVQMRNGRPLVIEFFTLLSFTCSWSFAWVTLLLRSYVTTSEWMCRLGLWACAILYASNKLVVYFFLALKVHVVANPSVAHLKDRALVRNVLLLVPYLGILVCYAMHSPGFYCMTAVQHHVARFTAACVHRTTFLIGGYGGVGMRFVRLLVYRMGPASIWCSHAAGEGASHMCNGT